MKRNPWFIAFALTLAGDLAGILLKSELLQYICKPLIVLSLFGWFVTETSRSKVKFIKWILAALFFSWAGDILLMFQEKITDFFLFGLTAFLLAHIFYIIFFHQVRTREGVKGKLFLLLPVALYFAGLILWLSPYLGDMTLPVRIYGIVISFMLMLALHMLYIKNKPAGKQLMAGAALFVVSDSILAINKFYLPFAGVNNFIIEAAGIIIMLTYGLAQFFIVKGAASYIRSANSS
ncbi:MAG: lysoplasmalogenase [Bacteroidota bacterium]